MSRTDIAYVLLMLMIVCVVAIVVQSHRFARYRRDLMRGQRGVKPVGKPFWLP